jgi:aminodeoxyfutalosine synthase
VSFFIPDELQGIREKTALGQRIDEADALRLLECGDLNALGQLADEANRRKNNNRASYILNRYFNYSNYCILSCQFCAFSRKKRDADGFELAIPDMVQKAREALSIGITELHIVGGLHPWLPFEHYTSMLSTIRDAAPSLHLKAFTAVELVHLQRISKRGRDGYEGLKAVLGDLIDAGLGSLPGGGALE